MNMYRRTATIVGVLFIIATANFMIGQAIYAPILGSQDFLETAYPQRTIVLAGLLLEFTSVLAIPLIPAFLFPVLKQHDEALSVGYLAFRTFEAVLNTLAIIGSLALLNLSRGYLSLGAADASAYLALGQSIQSLQEWAFVLSISFVFPVGALMFYWVLVRAALVPRVISIWGLLAAALLLLGSMLSMLEMLGGIPEAVLQSIIVLPIAVNEMVLALWLIVKGFSLSPTNSRAAGSARDTVRTHRVPAGM